MKKPRFAFDRLLLGLLAVSAIGLAGWNWLQEHPQHNPFAPLDLDDPPGWATGRKLVRLRGDPNECRATLARSAVAFTGLPPTGEGACRREDRLRLAADPARGLAFRPTVPEATCAVDAGLVLWLRHGVQPAAEHHLASRVVALEHFGTHSCRRLYGRESGGWSQHATGNAIDIAGFTLADGQRISVRRDWAAGGAAGAFLHEARAAACGAFGTVLSPDYNQAHADHLHLDQAGGRTGWSVCR